MQEEKEPRYDIEPRRPVTLIELSRNKMRFIAAVTGKPGDDDINSSAPLVLESEIDSPKVEEEEEADTDKR